MEGAEKPMNATFADIHAAADFIGPGAIEVPLYQTEIFDICRRSSPFGQRIKQVPATGHPSRFFEETAIPNPGTAGFVNPRSIVPTVVSPTRIEFSVPLKALVSQINYNLFDIELGDQQKQFAYLQAKDLVDTVSGVMVAHDVALWNGNDKRACCSKRNSWPSPLPIRSMANVSCAIAASCLQPMLWYKPARQSVKADRKSISVSV